MIVLCGTDFSPLAGQAARVAALIAREGGQRLHLVHAIQPSREPEAGGEGALAAPSVRSRLAEEVQRLQQLGIEATMEVVSGEADEVLVAEATRLGAQLIVLGAVGHRRLDRWLLGSCAERTAREATVPVLVVREGRCFEEWLCRAQALRVLVGCEPGPSSDAAVAWAGSLGQLGALDLVVARLAVPGIENRRFGESGPGTGLALDAHTEAALLDELRGQTTPLLGAMNVRLQVRTALGRIDQRLVAVAEELDSDLVVVGSHQREGFRRWWHGSASSGVLHSSPMSVGVVPFSATNPAVTRSEATGVNLSHQ